MLLDVDSAALTKCRDHIRRHSQNTTSVALLHYSEQCLFSRSMLWRSMSCTMGQFLYWEYWDTLPSKHRRHSTTSPHRPKGPLLYQFCGKIGIRCFHSKTTELAGLVQAARLNYPVKFTSEIIGASKLCGMLNYSGFTLVSRGTYDWQTI